MGRARRRAVRSQSGFRHAGARRQDDRQAASRAGSPLAGSAAGLSASARAGRCDRRVSARLLAANTSLAAPAVAPDAALHYLTAMRASPAPLTSPDLAEDGLPVPQRYW